MHEQVEMIFKNAVEYDLRHKHCRGYQVYGWKRDGFIFEFDIVWMMHGWMLRYMNVVVGYYIYGKDSEEINIQRRKDVEVVEDN